jgi:hypothetical protein
MTPRFLEEGNEPHLLIFFSASVARAASFSTTQSPPGLLFFRMFDRAYQLLAQFEPLPE